MTIEISIAGMSCRHCVRAVHEALAGVPGVTSAEVNLDAARARVVGSAPVADLVKAVREAGYQAAVVGA